MWRCAFGRAHAFGKPNGCGNSGSSGAGRLAFIRHSLIMRAMRMTGRDRSCWLKIPSTNGTKRKAGWRGHARPAGRVVMKRFIVVSAIGLALGTTWMLNCGAVFGQAPQRVQVPKFQYDPSFPQPLPEKWAIGAIGGMAVDSHDHIWVLHRPAPLQKNERFAGAAMTPPRADCCIPAPPVLAFDQDGKLLAAWAARRGVRLAVDRTRHLRRCQRQCLAGGKRRQGRPGP